MPDYSRQDENPFGKDTNQKPFEQPGDEEQGIVEDQDEQSLGLVSEWDALDDKAKEAKATEAGIPVESVDEMIRSAAEHPEFKDMALDEFLERLGSEPDLVIQIRRYESSPAPKTISEMKEGKDAGIGI